MLLRTNPKAGSSWYKRPRKMKQLFKKGERYDLGSPNQVEFSIRDFQTRFFHFSETRICEDIRHRIFQITFFRI